MYEYKGMKKISKENAIEIFKNGNKEVYRLYEDNSEGLIQDVKEFNNTFDEYGIGVVDMTFTACTMNKFNKDNNINWSGTANIEDFLECLEAEYVEFMYASYSEEETIKEYVEFNNDTEHECDLICIDNILYIAMY